MPESAVQDRAPTRKQIELAEWFAGYRGLAVPDTARRSNAAWWRWLNGAIRRIDREDAKEASIDFGIRVDFDDPTEIIGAVKYRAEVRRNPRAERANGLLAAGVHPYTVQDELDLTDQELGEAVRRAELDGVEIDWGSV